MIRATATLAGMPATPPPTVSVPNAAPETIVVSIWGGPPGPAGEPGAGVALQGVASTWPPSATPAVGDLYVVADPAPAGTPAGVEPGDGVVWTGTEWKSTGPIRGPAGEPGPEGPEGPQGPGSAVFEGADEPATAIEGDLWLKPETDPDGNAVLQLNVYTGTAWRPVAGGAGGLKPGEPGEFYNLLVGLRDNASVLPFDEGDIAANGAITAVGGIQSLTSVSTPILVYGPNAASPVKAAGRYEIPYPEANGYLRSDSGDADGWYFAEPVVLSEDPPENPSSTTTIWAKPVDAATAPVGSKGVTLEQVQAEIDSKLAGLGSGPTLDTAAIAAAILPDIRKAMNGGVLPPPDITTWTRCPIGPAFPGPQSSTVEIVQVNGVLYFRGDLVMGAGSPTQNSLFGFAYLELPIGFTAPPADTRMVVTGRTNASATSLTIGTVTVTSGRLLRFQIGNCDQVYLTGTSARVI